MSKQTLTLDKVRIDGGTQARASINAECVAEYAERIKAGDTFPDPVAFFDGAEHWLAEGFHRYHALRRLERKKADFDIRKGTLRDAILFAAAANSSHGLRRTSADKRKAVKMLLADPEWAGKSNRWIAEACCVSDMLVADVRDSTASSCSSSGQDAHDSAKSTAATKRKGKDGKTRTVKPPKAKAAKTSAKPAGIDTAAAEAEDLAEADKTPQQLCDEHNAALESFCRQLNDWFRENTPKLPWVTEGLVNSAKGNLKAACDTFRGVKCAVCPACEGGGCSECKDVGYLPKGSAAQLGRIRA